MIVERPRFRSYTIGNLNGIYKTKVKFPCEEEVIQKICNDIHVENFSRTNIRVLEVDDSNLNKSVAGLKMTLDELNYLEKMLDIFMDDEVDLFCAVAEVKSPKDGVDLINLSYNLHCYSLIDSSKNMEKMGRELFLHEAISCSTEELQQLNGQKYLAELMKNNTPWETSQGLLYPNKNEPTQEYNGINLPPFSYGGTAVEVVLTGQHPTLGTCLEILALPYYGSDLAKIRERMGVESYKDIKVSEIMVFKDPEEDFMAKMDLEEVDTADDLDNLSDVAEFYDLGTKEMCEQLNQFATQLKVDNLYQLSLVASGILSEELEFVESISTAEDYGYYLVCENEKTKIEEDIASFVDYEGYGESQLYGKSFVSTDDGMVIYHGDDVGMEQMMEHLEQAQEQTGMTDLN